MVFIYRTLNWKLVIVTILCVLAFGIGAINVSAKQTLNDASNALDAVVAPTGIEKTDTGTIAGTAVKGILGAIGLVFFVLMFYAGFVWMTARGEEDRINKARDTIIAACIGLVLVVSSYAITNLVVSRIINGQSGGSDGSSGDGTGNAPNTLGGQALGCCILPGGDAFSMNTAIPVITTNDDCANQAEEKGAGSIGTDWNFYTVSGDAGFCQNIALCWISESGGAEVQCIQDLINKQLAQPTNTTWCLESNECVLTPSPLCEGTPYSTENQCKQALQELNDKASNDNSGNV